MTTVQRAAQIFGIVFILVAILGFVASGGSMEADPEHAPRLLGLFPVNVLHNIVHLLFGVWGIAVYRNADTAITYARTVAVVYAVFVIMGFIPGLDTAFGLVPLHGNDIWLHALLAAGAGTSDSCGMASTIPLNRSAARGT